MDLDYFYGFDGPTKTQIIFRDSREKFKLFGGSLGGAKSWALCAEGCRLSAMYPGNRGAMFRAEAKSFKTTTLETLLKILDQISQILERKIFKHNKSDQKIHLFDNSIIMYGGLNDREDKMGVKSLEVGWYAIDEANECSKDQIDMIETRLRWILPDGTRPEYFGLYASNPEPCFIKDRFVTPQVENRKSPIRIFIPSFMDDNKNAYTGKSNLPDNYKEDLMDGKAEWWIKRYIMGSWDASKGQILDQFNPLVNVLPNPDCHFEIPSIDEFLVDKYPLILGGYDHGIGDASCFLGSFMDYEGNLFIFDEYYSSGLVSKHSREISNKFYINGFHRKVADPSIWNVTGERKGSPWSLSDEYSLHGMDFERANNSFGLSIDRMNSGFAFNNDRIHPITKRMGSPSTFISSRCKNLISQIGGYVWGKTIDNEKEKPSRSCTKHAVDAARYIHNELEEIPKEVYEEIPDESIIGMRDEFSRNSIIMGTRSREASSRRISEHSLLV